MLLPAIALVLTVLAACVSTPPAASPAATASPAPTASAATSPSAGPTPTPTPTLAPPTPTEVARLTSRASVGCAIGKALAGPAGTDPLPELADCNDPVQRFTPIPEGGLVTTDANGEAWIDTDTCGRIFLFQGSRLKASPCREDSPDTGAFCLEENSAAWQNECSGEVAIVTPSGAVSLQGTWLSVTYDPNRQVTLVCVFEGRAIATPFADVHSGRAEGRAIVEAGTFWFTSPNDRMEEIGGLEPRLTYGFEQLPAVMNEMGLRSWFTSIAYRAGADGVPMGDFPEPSSVNVRGGGGLLELREVQDAILLGTNWESATFGVFPDGETAVIALMGSGAPRELSFSGADPEEAVRLLKAAGAGGIRPWIIVDEDDALLKLAEFLTGSLTELGLEVGETIVAGSPEEAAATYDSLVAKETPVVWLARR